MVDGFEFQSEVSPAGQFASYLRKPIRQIDLLACLSTALKIPGFEELSTNFVLGLQNEKRESLQFRHGRVLVAEDNPANQLVAEAQLSELGLSARMVSNGKEVLSALESEPFLAILMDCQMPEMDGFQSARAIRELEKVSGKHIPIIAMTAGAMEGDRDSCLAAGMDDYVSKPVELDSLRQVLGKWLQKDDAVCANISSGANAVAASTEQDNSTKGAETLSKKQRPSIDIAGLAAMFGRDKVKKILEVFLPDSAISMSKLRAAIHQHDAKALNMLAHKLVGSYSTLRANELAKLSREIEQAALAEDWVTIQKRAKDIDEAYSIVYGESLNFLDEDGDAEPTN
jgi:CheY-like chemotaxis protein/HPt (histidine-containing phosphotransfer) domain-containing protein